MSESWMNFECGVCHRGSGEVAVSEWWHETAEGEKFALCTGCANELRARYETDSANCKISLRPRKPKPRRKKPWLQRVLDRLLFSGG